MAALVRFAVTTLGLMAAIGAVPDRAFAQLGDRVYPDHDFAALMVLVEELRIEASDIHVMSRYCKPPLPPNKETPQWEIDFVSLRLKRVRREFEQIKNKARASFGTPIGASYIGQFPRIDGIDLSYSTYEKYFGAALRLINAVAMILREKQARLDKAEVVDCAKPANRQPPAPPPDPHPPEDPSAGLKRPVPADIPDLKLPDCFNSLEEQIKFSELFRKSVFSPALNNEREAGGYSADVGYRVQDLRIAGKPALADQLRNTEGKWADDNHKRHSAELERVRQRSAAILKIPMPCPTDTPGTTRAAALPDSGGTSKPPRNHLVIEGGIGRINVPAGGTRVPIGSSPFTPLPNGLQTRRVPSHLFGDGAAQLNGLGDGIVDPLDPAFDRRNVTIPVRPAFVLRFLRDFNNAWAFYATMTVMYSGLGFNQETLDQIERTRATSVAALDELISGAATRTVLGTSMVENGGGYRVGFSAGAEFNFLSGRPVSWHPFARVGFGSIPASHSPATAWVDLDYAFTSPGSGAPFHETDRVTIRSRRPHAYALEFGGGVKKSLGRSLDLRVGAQVQVGPNPFEVSVETNPVRVLGTPAGAVIFNPPAGVSQTILMSNFSALNSSLSVTQPDTRTFKGSGSLLRLSVDAGIGFRF